MVHSERCRVVGRLGTKDYDDYGKCKVGRVYVYSTTAYDPPNVLQRQEAAFGSWAGRVLGRQSDQGSEQKRSPVRAIDKAEKVKEMEPSND